MFTVLIPIIITILIIASALGLAVCVSVNTAGQSLKIHLLLFGKIRLLKMHIFYDNGDFFVKFGRKNIKKIQKPKKRKRGIFSPDLSKIPTLKLKTAVINVNINSQENALAPVLASVILQNMLANLGTLTGGFLQIKHLKSSIFPAYTGNGVKINVKFSPKFYHFKIFLWFLHSIIKNIIGAIANAGKNRRLNKQRV